jgi:precorrin-6B methylase 2
MTNSQRRAARITFHAEHGDERFDEDDVQRDLGFNKSGNAVFDRLLEPPLEYLYPSPLGSELFFRGTAALGELAIVNMLLSREREPIVLDIGAGVGVHAVAWATAQPNSRVYAFERADGARELLARNAARVGPRLVVANDFGLGDAGATIDAFVARAELPRVTVVKIGASSSVGDVVAGASETLHAFRPALLVDVTSEPAAERTIAAIVARGYNAFAVVDGFVAPYKRYERAFATYLFIDARLRVMLPPFPGPESMLATTASRLEEIATLRSEVARLRASGDGSHVPSANELERVRVAEAKIKSLEAVCDERLRVINELNFALTRERKGAAREPAHAEAAAVDVEALREEVAMLRSVCDERAALIERLAAELRSAGATSEERVSGVARLVRELRETRATLDAVRAHVDLIVSL